MTNNKLTPKNVTRYAQYGVDMMEWPDGAYVKYEDYSALAAELQERRKAAIDSEPDCKERNLFCSTDTARMRKVISASAGTEDVQIYRQTQPVQEVIPECFRNAVSALESLYRNGQKQCWNERYTTDMAYASGVLNACRSAMLNRGE